MLGPGWRETLPTADVVEVVEREVPHLRRYALALTVEDDLAEGLATVDEEKLLGYAGWVAGLRPGVDDLIAEAFYWRWTLEHDGGELGC